MALRKYNDFLVVSLLTAILCLPFINKALQADSDMLVHAARMTIENPVAPKLGEYGSHMSLYNIHTAMPQNSLYYRCPHPPLVALYLAPVAAFAGPAEWPFHLAMLPFTLLMAAGCLYLLRRLAMPKTAFWSTVLFVISPAVLVNSQNVMWDTPVTASIFWSLGLLIEGTRRQKNSLVFFSGLAAGLGAVTKMSILPLLPCAFLFLLFCNHKRLLVIWTIPAVIPALLWIVHNSIIYGTIQYLATEHANFLINNLRYRAERIVSFLGGAAILPLFWYILALVRQKKRLVWILCATGALMWGAALVLVLHKSILFGFSYCLFAGAGAAVAFLSLIMLVGDKRIHSDTRERFLLVGFVILYACLMEILPAAEVRFLLPILPFALLYFMLEISEVKLVYKRAFFGGMIGIQGIVSVLLCVADAQFCSADRSLGTDCIKTGYPPDKTWYFGRLSFDYYLYSLHFRMLRAPADTPACGDFLIEENVPGDYGSKTMLQNHLSATPIDTFSYGCMPLRTMPPDGGFYGTDRLPFTIAWSLPQKRFVIYRIDRRQRGGGEGGNVKSTK